MISNIDILKTEIDRLVREGKQLIIVELETKKEKYGSTLSSNTISISYSSWYSEALPLIKTVLPDRYDEFVSYYLPNKNRKKIIYESFRIADYLTKVEEPDDLLGMSPMFNMQSTFINLFNVQIGIVNSCKNRLESKLDNIKEILQAELFDNELDSARHLHTNMFYRAAGMLAGVVLESHLSKVCIAHNINIPSKPTISNFNELLKSNEIIEIPIWRHLSLLGDLRNLCSHAKDKEPTREEVTELIDGVAKMIKKVY